MEKVPIAILVRDHFHLNTLNYCGENRQIIPCSFNSAEEMLSHEPRGAYSTGRTVNRNSVLELDFHVQRMKSSFHSIFTHTNMISDQCMHNLLFPSLQLGVNTFVKKYPEIKGDMKLTLFLTEDSNRMDKDAILFTHVSPLPIFPKSVNVEVRRASRHNPNVKDTEWVKLRKELDLKKAMDVNEVLIATESGDILEGTQTNFFVMDKSGKFQTAPEDQILPGTIRSIVLDLLKEKQLPLILKKSSQ